ncbi:unnamed protein product [Camellia sinensis]
MIFYFRNLSAKMSSPSSQDSPPLPTLPQNWILQLGCGSVTEDFLAAVAAFPNPDDKIRSTSFQIQGGGNTGNALTCAARLGLKPRLISKRRLGNWNCLRTEIKAWSFVVSSGSRRLSGSSYACGAFVADDARGRGILEELEADGIDTSFLVVSKEGNSPFTYVIVDKQTAVVCMILFAMMCNQKTRTCIHTPGFPPMIPDDLSKSSLLSALDGVRLIYLDGRLHETALVVAREANCRSIPILIDAERKREGLDDLLKFSDYVVCSAKFPQAWTEAPSVPSALVAMLLRLPNVKFVIVTLGEDGCIMLQRSVTEGDQSEEMDIDSLLESLKQRNDSNTVIPTCVSSQVVTKLRAHGMGTVSGRLFVGTAEKIPSSDLVDTTGAGDAFIGAVLYAICASMQPEKMLLFAAQVTFSGVLDIPILLTPPPCHHRHLHHCSCSTPHQPTTTTTTIFEEAYSQVCDFDCRQQLAVELWELEQVFRISLIHAWPLFYDY